MISKFLTILITVFSIVALADGQGAAKGKPVVEPAGVPGGIIMPGPTCAKPAWKAMIGYHMIVEGTYAKNAAGVVMFQPTESVVKAAIDRLYKQQTAYEHIDTSEPVMAEGTFQGRNYEQYFFFNGETIGISVKVDPGESGNGCLVTDVSLTGEF